MTNSLFDMPPEPKPAAARALLEPVIEGPAAAIYPLVPTRSFDEPFTYAVPPELVGELQVGTIVEIPVGKAARVGVVSALDVEAPPGVRLKPISRIVDQPVVPASLVRLAEWVADQYGCARTLALALVVGPRLSAQARASAVPTRRRQLAVCRLVDDLGGFDLTRRQRELAARVPMDWVSLAALLPAIGTTRPTLGKLAEAGVLGLEERFLDELEPIPDGSDIVAEAEAAIVGSGSERSLVELSAAQLHAVDVCAGDAPGSAEELATLLVGITGSGKTEVYLETIARSLDAGRGAIVLVPEIALTPQTARRFLVRFPGNVEVLHSAMTKAERAAAHERIARGAARVVVGPRSAIFAPVRDLGIIVIDEEHDGSYKQDSEPRYDARRVAFRRALSEGARLVLGSATPRPESWQGVRQRVIMNERPGGGRLAPLEVIDMREHKDEYPLSLPAQDAIEAALRRGRKAIVLHNRRGYAVALHCRDCGHTYRCPRCDVSLVIHGRIARRQRLSCHHCGHDEPIPERCTECQSVDLARMGTGSEQIERLLEERFPHQVFRLDADAVKTRGAVGEILDAFASAGPSILVGTQMVAKGHDFPDVELAVVIDADMALSIPDFRAEERAFQLVAQLAGRAGRSPLTAEHARVLVQTMDPSHSFLGFARTHDTEGFLAHELEQRGLQGFPPFGRFVRVLVSAKLETHRDRWANAVADGLRTLDAGKVRGPAPLMRINDRERSQVLVSTNRAVEVASAMRSFLRSTESKRRSADVRIALDVDPQSLM